ncbi:gliding motility lipoprotein GldH [Aquimarina rhabdastrellae]
MTKLNIFVLFTLLVLLISCDNKQVFDEYKSMPNGWHKDTLAHFSIPQLDTTKTYNVFLNVRNTNEYQYSNLYLITTLEFPKGKVLVDTLQYEMALPDGQWLGEGFTDVKENKLWYKEGVKFNEEGIYKVSIQHAMRKNGEVDGIQMLEGITDVGFRIENVQ